jgi:hypothetical protein
VPVAAMHQKFSDFRNDGSLTYRRGDPFDRSSTHVADGKYSGMRRGVLRSAASLVAGQHEVVLVEIDKTLSQRVFRRRAIITKTAHAGSTRCPPSDKYLNFTVSSFPLPPSAVISVPYSIVTA